MINNKSLYRQFDVWQKLDDNLVMRFCCFEHLNSSMFCVQSSDYFYLPIDDIQLHNSNKQLIELFADELPNNRGGLYSTIEEAIRHHVEDFES